MFNDLPARRWSDWLNASLNSLIAGIHQGDLIAEGYISRSELGMHAGLYRRGRISFDPNAPPPSPNSYGRASTCDTLTGKTRPGDRTRRSNSAASAGPSRRCCGTRRPLTSVWTSWTYRSAERSPRTTTFWGASWSPS
jgi:hypothetical protein